MKSLELSGIGMTSQRTRERLVQRLADQGIKNLKVLDVIRSTPRHIFLDEAFANRAYEDTALPIGHGQTISQPYVVARMTELLLSRRPLAKVLEIGTGSGYQGAVLSQLVDHVYSVERIQPLLKKAKERFRKLGIRNITAELSDGTFGWERFAPYDGIITTAAPRVVPDSLLMQVAPDGIVVIPVGGDGVQELRVITRQGDSWEFDEEIVEQVRFVPLLGGTRR